MVTANSGLTVCLLDIRVSFITTFTLLIGYGIGNRYMINGYQTYVLVQRLKTNRF